MSLICNWIHRMQADVHIADDYDRISKNDFKKH